MTLHSAIALARMALLFFLAESPLVSLLAGAYPTHVAAIVLAGAFVVAMPPGIMVARALRGMAEDDLAANYRKSERLYFLAAAASQLGMIMANLGRGAVGPLGIVVSALGMLAAFRLTLKAASA